MLCCVGWTHFLWCRGAVCAVFTVNSSNCAQTIYRVGGLLYFNIGLFLSFLCTTIFFMLVVHSMNSLLLAKNKELELLDVDYTSNTNYVTVCQKIETYLLQGCVLAYSYFSINDNNHSCHTNQTLDWGFGWYHMSLLCSYFFMKIKSYLLYIVLVIILVTIKNRLMKRWVFFVSNKELYNIVLCIQFI